MLVLVTGMMITSLTNNGQLAFAESDSAPTILVSDKLKSNPLAMKIIAEMEGTKIKIQPKSRRKNIWNTLNRRANRGGENKKIG